MSLEDREAIRDYYDELGDSEVGSSRRDSSRPGEPGDAPRFLARFIRPQSRVLEIGFGPGRFTSQLAALGTPVTVTDISSVQLDLNRLHVPGTPAEQTVESRELLDVCDTSGPPDDSFDAVMAFGRPPRRHRQSLCSKREEAV
jgi:2-polyprenyl-3-methyl-5-hydroxy-6-metoxy-1,4-benzoquinol methylase